MKTRLFWIGLALTTADSPAEVKLPAIFGDHMVLQNGVRAPVRGWAGHRDQVTIEFWQQKKAVVTLAKGESLVKPAPVQPKGNAGEWLITSIQSECSDMLGGGIAV